MLQHRLLKQLCGAIQKKKKPDLLKELLSIDPKIEYIQGIANDIETMFVRSINNMIILDDLVDEAIYQRKT